MDEFWDFIVGAYYVSETFPLEIFIAFVLVLSNFIIFSFLLVLLIFLLLRTNVLSNKVSDLSPRLEVFFDDVLRNNKKYSDEYIVKEYRQLIKKRTSLRYRASIEIMLKLKEEHNYSVENVNRVFSVLSFGEFLNEKTSDLSPRQTYKTIDILKELEISSKNFNVLHLIESKSTEVGKKAKLLYLLSNNKDSYNFLETIEDEMTQWDLIELMRSFENLNKKGELQSLSKWVINCNNKLVISFLIKAIGHFGQVENRELIIEKITDKEEEIREAAIEAAGALMLEEVESVLRKRYKNETYLCQKAIIKSIKSLNTGKSLNFLEELYNETHLDETDLNEIKTSVVNTIYSYNIEGRNLFEKLKEDANDSKLSILKHVEAPLIKFKEYA